MNSSPQHPQQKHAAALLQGPCRFAEWCEGRGLHELAQVKPLHVAAYLEVLLQELAKPSVKQQLPTLRMLFPWLDWSATSSI